MSVDSARSEAVMERIDSPSFTRMVALLGVLIVLGAFLYVLRNVLIITGNPLQLYALVGGAFAIGTVAALLVRPRIAALLSGIAAAIGTAVYIWSLPGGVGFLTLLTPLIGDAFALLSGDASVLRIVNADVWALSVAPGPVFLVWYLGLRKRYVSAAGVAGTALGLVVLTGDATAATTLVGIIGITVAVAFGDCERRGEQVGNADGGVTAVAVVIILLLLLAFAPSVTGAIGSFGGFSFGDSGQTMESSLVHAGDNAPVTGPVELSPEVRYTVTADRQSYWRVGTYDRYTGGGWVRSGEPRPYEGPLAGPPGSSSTLQQSFRAETEIATLPAARQPTRIENAPVPVQVTEGGSFEPTETLQAGDTYAVESQVPTAPQHQLRTISTDYPDGIEERYTQLPDDTPDRVAERTDEITQDASRPYDTAVVLESYFKSEYEYSLDVERPRGDVADEFLFEMEAGYCTYFATTMVTMLRTQGIPARFVVGYTSGQQVDEETWVVRGSNSHAWVEVYIPGQGWIEFDPTPAQPREAAERQALSDARDDGINTDIDTEDTRDELPEVTDPSVANPEDAAFLENRTGSDLDFEAQAPGADDLDGDDSFLGISVVNRDQLGFVLVLLGGLIAGVYRSGVGGRIRREMWLRRVPEGSPDAIASGVYHRIVYLEERSGRTKAPGETPRQFLAGADERAKRIGELYERSRYGGGIDEAAAEEAVENLENLLNERSRLPAWMRRLNT